VKVHLDSNKFTGRLWNYWCPKQVCPKFWNYLCPTQTSIGIY